MNYFIEDLNVFYATIYGGILIGILFDINRSLKDNFKIINKIYFVFDILFWMIVTFTIFLVVNAIERFELRYYHFIALLLGFALYYNTVSKFVLKFSSALIKFIKSLIRKILVTIIAIIEYLYYITIYSIHFLFDIIFYIPNIVLMLKRRASKKSLIKKKLKKGV